jgi:hypothetical protein
MNEAQHYFLYVIILDVTLSQRDDDATGSAIDWHSHCTCHEPYYYYYWQVQVNKQMQDDSFIFIRV